MLNSQFLRFSYLCGKPNSKCIKSATAHTQNVVAHLKKIWNILLILVGIVSLALIAITIFIATSMGKRANTNFNKDNGIKIVNRILYVYEYDSLKSKTDYELKILERDSVRIFKYNNLKDSTRNMSFRFNKLNSNLYFGPDKFKVVESKNYRTEFNFDKYELTEPIMDGVGPILFNKTYGVLAWDNNWGNQFYLVNEVNMDKIDLPIFKYNLE